LRRSLVQLSLLLIATAMVMAQGASPTQAPGSHDLERLTDGVRLQTRDGFLTVHVKSDSIVRVTFAKEP